MKKRKLMIGSMMLLVVLLVAGGTFAWFTASAGPVVNEFKAGTIILTVEECFNQCDANRVNPGDTVEKHVRFHNDGSKRMFVRVELDEVFKNANNEVLVSEGIVSYDINDGWVYHDGYYYYTSEVLPGDYTPTIIDGVSFDGPNMGNEYQGSKFTLTVKADAIQVTNNAALTVWGIDPLTLAS